MVKEQPKALRLADALEAIHYHNADSILALNVIRQAGPELRRLHAENEALRCQKLQAVADQADQMTMDKALLRQALEALEGMEKWASSIYDGYPPSTASIAAAPYREAARAAIEAYKVKQGETK